MHYLDNSATTMVLESAAQAAVRAMREEFGNPSSVYELGRWAQDMREDARQEVARLMGCSAEQVTFVSCGTEGTNTAMLGGAHKMRHVGRHLITTEIEHAATLQCAGHLESQGWEVTRLAPDRQGQISLEQFERALRPDTALVSCMLVNNEVGAILPVEQMGAILRRRQSRAMFYVDAVQALGRVPLNVQQWPVDAMSVSAHKIGAPKGVGALYVRKGLSLPPLLLGGGQERGFRSGTENMPAIAAFGEACRQRREHFDENLEMVRELNRYLLERVAARFPRAVINGGEGVPHVVNLSFPGCKSEVLLRILSQREVYVSSGSSCSKGKASHVLRAMRLPPERIDSALRISFCPENTKEDIDALMEALEEATARFVK